ncbi:trypsin-like serine proteinase 3 [Penaeus vannamei]|uniref:Trypsin-like serine proteinase 3 n=1 Tax=Penaeus vannamei TaxID=6689 RepID=A0A423TL93_PENVA|nr:trypsin-like serine proteinase 3 [Penaeus vannamei]
MDSYTYTQNYTGPTASSLSLGVSGQLHVHTNYTGRIVGGVEARPGEFPFQVFLSVTKFGTQFLCGGALLDESRVLTAAHCLEGVAAPEDIRHGARGGDHASSVGKPHPEGDNRSEVPFRCVIFLLQR